MNKFKNVVDIFKNKNTREMNMIKARHLIINAKNKVKSFITSEEVQAIAIGTIMIGMAIITVSDVFTTVKHPVDRFFNNSN